MNDLRASVPKVNDLLLPELIAAYGHKRVTRWARRVLASARERAQVGIAPALDHLLAELSVLLQSELRPVINATGVIVHTNLGRAPWGAEAQRRAARAAGYCSVEMDLMSGRRGQRGASVEERLCALTGAENALIVNNCAGAVFLMLSALARGKSVLVSRGELVEIGGGFRVPDIMRASGAELVEVGTTNRTHLRDFESALDAEVAGILRVHHSNFKQVGFVTQPDLKALGSLPVPLLMDLGSGQLGWDESEPSVQEALDAGAAVICMSGDKLLGGPQSGIILGRKDELSKMRRHPLYRALRPDKVILAALEGTLDDWLTGVALPIQKMRGADLHELEQEVIRWRTRLAPHAAVDVVNTDSTVGGGSLPGAIIPSFGVALEHPQVERLSAALRAEAVPIIGRIEKERLILDARTVMPVGQSDSLIEGVIRALENLAPLS